MLNLISSFKVIKFLYIYYNLIRIFLYYFDKRTYAKEVFYSNYYVVLILNLIQLSLSACSDRLEHIVGSVGLVVIGKVKEPKLNLEFKLVN